MVLVVQQHETAIHERREKHFLPYRRALIILSTPVKKIVDELCDATEGHVVVERGAYHVRWYSWLHHLKSVSRVMVQLVTSFGEAYHV